MKLFHPLPVIIGCACLLLSSTGCRTARTDAAGPAPEHSEAKKLQVYGEILKVREAYGYIVARCLVIPASGEIVGIYRNHKEVAVVRTSERQRTGYITADILSGEPRVGDVLKQIRIQKEAGETKS